MRDGHLTHLSRFGSEIWFGSLSCGKSLAFFKWLNPFTVLISGLSVGHLHPDLLYLLESFLPSVPAIFPAVGCHIQYSVLLGLLCWTLGDMIFLFSPNVMYHQLLWMQNHRSSLSSSSYAFFTATKTQWSSFILYINTLKANNTSVALFLSMKPYSTSLITNSLLQLNFNSLSLPSCYALYHSIHFPLKIIPFSLISKVSSTHTDSIQHHPFNIQLRLPHCCWQ